MRSSLQSLRAECSSWNIWLIVWALLLSFCWLAPNHDLPWQFFYSDAWAALVLLIAVPVLFYSARQKGYWSTPHSIILLLASMPMAQYACGLIVPFGAAWIGTAYLLGLLCSILLGSHWERNHPGQAIDGVLLAIAIAALASVGMQIYQWFGLEGMGIWIRGTAAVRQSANLGQPNQLASLLLLGCLSIAWGYERKKLGGVVATLACTFVMTGVAITGSRTAWVAAVLLTVLVWAWKGRWRNTNQPWIATWLLAYLLALSTCLPFLRHLVFDGAGTYELSLQQLARVNSEQRLVAWTMFLHAIWIKPWLGYGWAQMAHAQAEVASLYPQLHSTFLSAHNLLLDILLSCGIPIGLLLIGLIAWWLYKTMRSIGSAENAIIFMALLVLLNHAMLELPLYYGYFLWPAGVLAGVLTVRTSSAKTLRMQWVAMPLVWLVCVLFLVTTACDYFGVEDEYQSSTINEISIHSTRTLDTRQYRFLTQWDEFFKYGKLMPARDMQDQDIAHLQGVVLMWPNVGLFNKLAMALAMHNRPEEAALWLRRACAMTPETSCNDLLQYWQNVLWKSPEFARVRLPSKNLPDIAL